MFSRHYRKIKGIFSLIDSVLVAFAFIAAYLTRTRIHTGGIFRFVFYFDLPIAALLLGVSVLSWLAVGYWFNIYEKLDSANPRVVLRDTFRQCLLGAVGLVLAEFMLRLDVSRSFVLIFSSFAWVLLCLFRINGPHLIGFVNRRLGTAHLVMLVGSGASALRFAKTLEDSSDYGVRLLGFLDPEPNPEQGEIHLAATYPRYPLDELPQILRRQVIDEIIFAVDSAALGKMEDVFLLCEEEGVRTRVVLDFFPHLNSQTYLEHLGDRPLLTFTTAPHDEVRLMLKRVMDLILAAAALVLLLPFMLLLALLIKLTSPGPAIFRQQRCGLNGRRFTFYKFRSMCDNAEQLKASLQHLNQKSTAFKIPDDPRLTGLGRFLRKFSIDEWPQLWNVLKGDMSLVGPRPPVPEEVELYQSWQRRRLRMRPGLTCLWAVAGRDHLDFDTWMKMDLQYIDTWSLELDWEIILRTIPRVLTGSGAN